jgi:16S rRNA pseudouridine516 synthase
MNVIKYLGNLGYGSRREVTQIVKERRVTRRDGSIVRDGDSFVHDDVLVDDEPLDPAPGSVLMLHKPTGYVCSTNDAGRLIYELLPARFPHRSPVMAPIGRLDRDTSGLLLLTDDGQINHRLSSPRTHLPKIYEARLASALRGDEADIFASGVLMLTSETKPLQAATLEVIGERRVRLTLTEGRYHQVRRMFAAVGNHVDTLHRHTIGGLDLGSLESGKWRVLSASDMGSLFSG